MNQGPDPVATGVRGISSADTNGHRIRAQPSKALEQDAQLSAVPVLSSQDKSSCYHCSAEQGLAFHGELALPTRTVGSD